jgi:predicted amidophosphoribosyltransferase
MLEMAALLLVVAITVVLIVTPSRRGEPQQRVCGGCGATWPRFAQFCGRCGKRL